MTAQCEALSSLYQNQTLVTYVAAKNVSIGSAQTCSPFGHLSHGFTVLVREQLEAVL